MSTLLLHGFTGSSQSWGDGLIDALASLGPPPVLVDLPGHGRHAGDTDPDHFTLEAVLESIGDASGGEPIDLVGYSMGGRLALAYAVAHPEAVRTLVLESASPGLATPEEREQRRASDEALARSLEAQGIEAFVDQWERLALFESQQSLPEHVRAAQRGRRELNDPASLSASLRGLGTGSLPSYWPALASLSMPVLVLTGELDGKFASIARDMAARIPSSRLGVVPGAGHAVHLERPDAWLSAVLDFLPT